MRLSPKRSLAVATLGALASAGGCKDAVTVPDLNNVPSTTIENGLTPSTLQLLTTGAFNANRTDAGFRYIVFGETLGRNVYNIDPSESRFITQPLGGTIDPGGFLGGGSWAGFFNTVRTANVIIDKLPTLADSLSATQIAATRGALRTLKALSFYDALSLRGTNGIPIDVNKDVTAQPGPILCQPNALAAIAALLDSAYTDLQGGGTTFPFKLPGGFSLNGNFSTVAGFAQFNRALKGRVEVYRGLDQIKPDPSAFQRAITALNASFLDVTAPLDRGVYYTYSTAPNEQPNPLATSTIFLNPTVGDSIQAGDRRASKITTVTATTRSGVTTRYKSPLSDPGATNQVRSIPLIRNAELILLRAQAEIGLGQLAAATADANVVRVGEGGPTLTPYSTFATAKQAITSVLYEKRYSLLLEGDTRLVDLRTYGLLNATYQPSARTGDTFQTQLPIPKTETDARGGVQNAVAVCN